MTYEYLVAYHHDIMSPAEGDLTKWLNAASKDGWELIAAVPVGNDTRYIFRRPVDSAPSQSVHGTVT